MRKREFRADLKPRGQVERLFDRKSWRSGSAEQRFASEWESALEAMRRRGGEGGAPSSPTPGERPVRRKS